MAQTSTIVLVIGDYADRLQRLWEAAREAENFDGVLLAGEEHPHAVIAAEYEALKAESDAASRADGKVVTLRAVGRREWRRLKEAHPPRTEGDDDTLKGDRAAGLNTTSAEDDLVHASLIEPGFSTRADFDAWADSLSEGEWQTIVRRAWELANVASVDPKSLPPLRTRSDGES